MLIFWQGKILAGEWSTFGRGRGQQTACRSQHREVGSNPGGTARVPYKPHQLRHSSFLEPRAYVDTHEVGHPTRKKPIGSIMLVWRR